MNQIEAMLLERSMSNLGDTFLKNRQLNQQASEHAADRDLRERLLEEQISAGRWNRDAQKAHYSEMEKANAERNQILAGGIKNKELELKSKQAAQDFKDYQASQKEMLKMLGQSVVSGQMPPEDAQYYFQRHLAELSDNNQDLYNKISQEPTVAMILSGKADWKGLANINTLQTSTVEDASGGKHTIVSGKTGAPHELKPPSEGAVSTTIKQVPNPAFVPGSTNAPTLSLTNTTTKGVSPSSLQTVAPGLSAPAPAAAPSLFKAGTRVRNRATGKTATLTSDGVLPDGYEPLQ